MRRSVFLPAVALFTFLAGTWAVGLCAPLSGLVSSAVEAFPPGPSAAEVERVMRLPPGRVTHGLRVRFLRTQEKSDGLYGAFLITNEGPQVVTYRSYLDEGGFPDFVNQAGMVANQRPTCGNGVVRRTLKPGESASFYAKVPDRRAPLQAGFGFLVGSKEQARQRWETIWSETIFPPFGMSDTYDLGLLLSE